MLKRFFRESRRRNLIFRLVPAVCLLPLTCLVLLPADIIDRIAISAGYQVITESQIDEEVRVTEFLNGEKLDLSAGERKKAAGRLVEQALVKREMELSRYPLPPLSDADKQLQMLKAGYPSEAQFQDALGSYGIAEDALKRRLWWQLTLLRFVDFRFRPGIQVQDSDVQEYYKQQVATWQKEGMQSIPSFGEARGQIEEILTQQRIDEAMNQWLSEVRMQVSVRYRDETLQ
jgi:peptidyl-prolyl cis-trans isomerase SurA